MTPRLAFLKSLWVVLACLAYQGTAAQNALQPYKLALYQDAVRISYKGVIAFNQQRADIPLDFHVDTDGLDLATNASAKIQYYRVRVDSLLRRVSVANWTDILMANISKRVTVVFQIGQEFDDVDGDVRYVNEEAGMLLLHGTNNSEYFIPLAQIQQVVVPNQGEYKFDKLVLVDVLEVGIDNDAASIPLEMFSINTGVTWSPVCRLRITGSNKARLQMQAILANQLSDFKDVEIELNTGKLLDKGTGTKEAEPVSGGKLSLRKGDHLVLNVRDLELEYESAFRSTMLWKSLQADGRTRPFAVDNTLRLSLPPNSALVCDQYTVVDEHNRQIANVSGGELTPDGAVSLNLGTADEIKVSLVETELKRESKPVKIGNLFFEQVSVEARIVCQNFGQKYAQIQVSREFVGTVVDAAKGMSTTSPNADSFGPLKEFAKMLTWKQSLDKGQKKEIIFKYDALLPKQ